MARISYKYWKKRLLVILPILIICWLCLLYMALPTPAAMKAHYNRLSEYSGKVAHEQAQKLAVNLLDIGEKSKQHLQNQMQRVVDSGKNIHKKIVQAGEHIKKQAEEHIRKHAKGAAEKIRKLNAPTTTMASTDLKPTGTAENLQQSETHVAAAVAHVKKKGLEIMQKIHKNVPDVAHNVHEQVAAAGSYLENKKSQLQHLKKKGLKMKQDIYENHIPDSAKKRVAAMGNYLQDKSKQLNELKEKGQQMSRDIYKNNVDGVVKQVHQKAAEVGSYVKSKTQQLKDHGHKQLKEMGSLHNFDDVLRNVSVHIDALNVHVKENVGKVLAKLRKVGERQLRASKHVLRKYAGSKLGATGSKCKCVAMRCHCCQTLSIKQLDEHKAICVNFTFVQKHPTLKANLSVDGSGIYDQSLAAHGPAQVCLASSDDRTQLCTLFTNTTYMISIDTHGHHTVEVKGCILAYMTLTHVPVAAAPFGCFRISTEEQQHVISTEKPQPKLTQKDKLEM